MNKLYFTRVVEKTRGLFTSSPLSLERERDRERERERGGGEGGRGGRELSYWMLLITVTMRLVMRRISAERDSLWHGRKKDKPICYTEVEAVGKKRKEKALEHFHARILTCIYTTSNPPPTHPSSPSPLESWKRSQKCL